MHARYILPLFIFIYSANLFAQNKKWTLQTDDTRLTIGVNQKDQLCIFSVGDKTSKYNFTNQPSVLPFVDTIETDNKQIATQWKFSGGVLKNNTLTLSFINQDPALQITSTWQARKGPGPVRHTLFIKNHSLKPVAVHEQESIQLSVSAPGKQLRATYVNDDASRPDSIGVYHKYATDGFNKDLRVSELHDWIPFVIFDAANKNGIYAGWEWSAGRVHLEGSGESAMAKMGNGDHFKTDIQPGASLEIPPAFIGAYYGDLDACGNRLRKYLFNHMMPDIITKDKGYPKVEWNAFAALGKNLGSWDPVESKYYPLIDDIAPLGFEEVVIDIGWWKSYNDPGNIITDSIDWPKGMAAAAKYAQDRGMRFGLYGNEPENYASDTGVAERIRDITYLIKDLHADFFRSDGTGGPIVNKKYGLNDRVRYEEDRAYWSFKGFYAVIDSLYSQIPGFSWENCFNGGRLKDYGAVRRSSKIQNLDIYYPVDGRRSFYDATFAMHPMQLACVVGSWKPWQASGSVYEFRSGAMGAAYWHPDAPNGGNGGPVWSDKQKAEIKKAVTTYKEKLRPLIRSADLYHNFPRPDSVVRDGIEYYDPSTGKGVVFIFQHKYTAPEPVLLKGLEPQATYSITFEDGSNAATTKKGSELMQNGIVVALEGNLASELMFFEKQKK